MNTWTIAWWYVLCESWLGLALCWLVVGFLLAWVKHAWARYLIAFGAMLVWTVVAFALFIWHGSAFRSEPDFVAIKDPQTESTWSHAGSMGEIEIEGEAASYGLTLWMIGCTGVLAWQTWLLLGLAQIRRQATLAPEWLSDLVAQESARLRIKAPPIFISNRVDTPCLIGCWRPTMVWPRQHLERSSRANISLLVCHELVHLQRSDAIALHLQVLIESLFFYHPALWSLSAIARHEREAACDARVLALGANPSHYAKALLELEEFRSSTLQLLAIAARSSPHPMFDRLKRILNVQHSPTVYHHRPRKPVIVLAFTGLVIVLVATLNGSSGQATQPCMHETCAQVLQVEPRLAPYWDLFHRVGARYDLEPALLAALCLTESAAQPEVVSPMGAIGLMQIMPKTFDRLAQERGLTSPSDAERFDVAINVDYAAYLLKRDLIRYTASHGDREGLHWALAAYNAGTQRVEAAQRGERELPDETQRYSSHVMQHLATLHDVIKPQN